jgi:hypothetical protein
MVIDQPLVSAASPLSPPVSSACTSASRAGGKWPWPRRGEPRPIHKDAGIRAWVTLNLVSSIADGTRDRSFRLDMKKLNAMGGTSLVLALLQSLCTAVLTVSGIRVAIGLSALAAASGIYAPARGFHQDAIRIPMLILASAGAILNLAVLAWIRRLRSLPSAQWRRREISAKEKRSERLQVTLAVLTLILVGLETWTHPMVHRTGAPPAARTAAN